MALSRYKFNEPALITFAEMGLCVCIYIVCVCIYIDRRIYDLWYIRVYAYIYALKLTTVLDTVRYYQVYRLGAEGSHILKVHGQ